MYISEFWVGFILGVVGLFGLMIVIAISTGKKK